MDMTKIIEAIITLLFALISVFVIPYVKKYIEKKISQEDLKTILKWVMKAVKAAEQIYDETGMGEKKRKYVEEFLTEHNIVVDLDKLDVLIESAVYELKKEFEVEKEFE